MGEAQRRRDLGYQPEVRGTGGPPRYPNGGQQINVDLTNATPRLCECGCKYFVPVMTLFTVSALLSPIGKELTALVPALLCRECGTVLEVK